MGPGTNCSVRRFGAWGTLPSGGISWNRLHEIVVTPDAMRRRAIGQILLLAAGFLVLVAISATSVILVDEAREDNAWVVHTIEVENQLSTLLLQIRRAESAARGYLLTSDQRFLDEHEAAVATILPDVDKLAKLTTDNPVQVENAKRLRAPIRTRLEEFAKAIDFAKRNDVAGGTAMLREYGANDTVEQLNSIANAMQVEE